MFKKINTINPEDIMSLSTSLRRGSFVSENVELEIAA